MKTSTADAADADVQQVVSVESVDAGDPDKAHIQVTDNGVVVDHGLRRTLKQRHLQMIALGGVVGASIWYGTGVAIASAGPVGTLISFVVMSIDVFFVMQTLGELCTLYPSTGSFTELAGRFIDPAVSVALGYNYWYLWASNIAAEYNLVSILLTYWTDKVPAYGWILLAWAFYQGLSLFGVIVYGEMEYWLSVWKIICIFVTYLLAILCNTGAIGGDYIGFRFWKNPGPFVNGINGFGTAFVLAAAYHCGTEMVTITAGETKRPEKVLPKAIRQTLYRIVFIYWGLVFFAGISVASDDPAMVSATSRTGLSPFSVALKNAGWKHGPDLINAFMFTASFSAINSSVYISSRTLYSLADLGRAPAFLKKTIFNNVPIYAAIASNAVGLLALVSVASGGGKAFSYIVNLLGAACFIAYSVIGVIHLRFRKAWRIQGHTADELPFRALWYPYGAYFIVIFNLFLLFIHGYDTVLRPFHTLDFIFSYIIIILFILLWAGWKLYHKTHMVNLAEVDLQYGQRSYLTGGDDEEDKPSWFAMAVRSSYTKFMK